MSSDEQSKPKSVYEVLSEINVNTHKQKKGMFDYLSWADAVDILLKSYPTATWKIERFSDELGIELPYLKTDSGYFVEVSVTIDGITRSQLHPVLDNRNRPIEKPTSFQINTSQQRALAKAIALHGLGLYIFRGEDLPSNEDEPAEKKSEKKETKATKPKVKKPSEVVKPSSKWS